MNIRTPYLLYLGDVQDPLAAKTARGIAYWRPELCLGETALPSCTVSLDLPALTIEEAAAQGAQTLVVGLAQAGGGIPEHWKAPLLQALEAGLDIASGLHVRLNDVPELKAAAAKFGRRIQDVRCPAGTFPVGNGKKRSGKRVLTVGTDCSVGKMYTSLALEKEMKVRGWNVDFRATGQTGILIAGGGISVDAVVADFISGATEQLSPENCDDHWDVIEGQGSLFHPSYAGVSLGLLHGAQPDYLILCHDAGRPHMRGLPDRALPELTLCIEHNLAAARVTNPAVRFAGVSLNSSALSEDEARSCCERIARELGVPCLDPLRHSMRPFIESLEE